MNFWYIASFIWLLCFIVSFFSQDWGAMLPTGWLVILSYMIGAGKFTKN